MQACRTSRQKQVQRIMSVYWSLLVLVCFLGLVSSASDSQGKQCIKKLHSCIRNSECCTGCCNQGKCAEYAEHCTIAQNPCSLHDCPPGKKCSLHQVDCVSSDCDPIPYCHDQDYEDY